MHKCKLIAVGGMVLVLLLSLVSIQTAFSQDFATGAKSLVEFNRGIMWDSWDGNSNLAGGGCGFSWYAKKMDYPGHEPSLLKAEGIGSWPTHMFEVSFGVAALRSPGFYPDREPDSNIDVQLAATTLAIGFIDNPDYDPVDSTSAWIMPVNQKRWKNGENYFLRANALEAEEVIDSRMERNHYYKWSSNTLELDRHFLPIRVDWSNRMWSGSRQDQMWEIQEMTVTNMSDLPQYDNYTGDDITLYETMFKHSYWSCVNLRSSSLRASRNSRGYDDLYEIYEFEPGKKIFVTWDDDWKDPISPLNDRFDFVPEIGPEDQGEWAAPGFVGFGFLHTTPDNFGNVARLDNFWTARCEEPGSGTDAPYQGLSAWGYFAWGQRSNFALRDEPRDPKFGTVLFDTHLITGPYDIAPGESVNLVSFKGIGAVDMEISGNYFEMAEEADIATGKDSLYMLIDRAALATKMAKVPGYATGGTQFAGWNLTDPPACPYDFTITPYLGGDAVLGTSPGNIITWDDWADTHSDKDYAGMPATTLYPDGEEYDLINYTVWKSEYLPIMGWEPIAVIEKKDADYYDAATGTYEFIDTDVKIGFSYFYALSSADGGHDTWPPRPEAIAEYPRIFIGGKVPQQQSNLWASLDYPSTNTKWVAFRTYRTPGASLSEIRVFPNPFVMRAGFINPTDQDGIHFANIPAQCKIKIYSVRGDLIAEGPGTIQIKQDEGAGEAVWGQLTQSEQYVESGLYFYTVEALSGPDKGSMHRGKFVIIR